MSEKISLFEILSLNYLSKMIVKRKAELLTDIFDYRLKNFLENEMDIDRKKVFLKPPILHTNFFFSLLTNKEKEEHFENPRLKNIGELEVKFVKILKNLLISEFDNNSFFL